MDKAPAPPETHGGPAVLLLTENPDLESLVRAALERLALQIECVARSAESIRGQWKRTAYSAVLIDFEDDRGPFAYEAVRTLDASVTMLLLANRDGRSVDNPRVALVVLPAKERDRAQAAAELRGRLEFRLRALLPPKNGCATARPASQTTATPTTANAPRDTGSRADDATFPSIEQLLPSRGAGTFELLVIGSSTGGPAALTTIMRALPELPLPVLIVQHMPPLFTGLLARQLDVLSPNRVIEAKGNEILAPGTCFLAPGDFHLTLTRRGSDLFTSLDQNTQENSCRPAVDPLFRSAAQHVGRGVLAVVLTGMGTDGTAGARCIRAAGGCVVAQDRGSSVVWGMPGSIVKSGLADGVVSLDAAAGAIVRLIGDPRATSRAKQVSGE